MSDISSAGMARVAPTTARPAARMFFAALISRSCRVPQDGHCHTRIFKLSSARTCPHAEHIFDDGYHRSITITRRPALAALYSSISRKVPHPQSEIAFATLRLRTMFLTARSSRQIRSWSRTRRVEVLWRKSARAARTLRCARAAFALALPRFAEPGWQRAIRRW